MPTKRKSISRKQKIIKFNQRKYTCWHHLARTWRRKIRCLVLKMYLRRSIFFCDSDWSSAFLDFSTSSLSARNESSAVLRTTSENATVFCPSSAAILLGFHSVLSSPWSFPTSVVLSPLFFFSYEKFREIQRREKKVFIDTLTNRKLTRGRPGF